MRKPNLLVFVLCLLALFSCGKKNKKKVNSDTSVVKKNDRLSSVLSEKDYVLNEDYPKGDVRRYGIFPDSSYVNIHPVSNQPKITTVLDMAEKNKVELFFPKGYYKTALLLDSRQDMTLDFDQAEFDLVHITQASKEDNKPKNITLKGTLILYDRLGLTEAINIGIDSVLIRSDEKKSIRKMRSRGCHIYHGCNDIRIKYLEIEDFGSGDSRYKNNHASLAVDGWRNNPENLYIGKLHIKSTDRHGVYLTGSYHRIDEIVIDQFGVGSATDMMPMQDASVLEHELFAGIWINRCYDSSIGSVVINAKSSDGFFTANFDEGDKERPVMIYQFTVQNFDRTLPIYFAENTGVVVENLTK